MNKQYEERESDLYQDRLNCEGSVREAMAELPLADLMQIAKIPEVEKALREYFKKPVNDDMDDIVSGNPQLYGYEMPSLLKHQGE